MKTIIWYYYKDIAETFKYFINKYWPECELFLIPNQTPKFWSNKIIDYLKSFNEKYFITAMEDLFWFKPIDNDVVNACIEFAITNNVDKLELSGSYGNPYFESILKYKKLSLGLLKQNVSNRMGLQAAIWKKEYFLNKLIPNMTAWNFDGSSAGVNDKGIIYSLIETPFYHKHCIHFMRHGKSNRKQIGKINTLTGQDKKIVDDLFNKYYSASRPKPQFKRPARPSPEERAKKIALEAYYKAKQNNSIVTKEKIIELVDKNIAIHVYNDAINYIKNIL